MGEPGCFEVSEMRILLDKEVSVPEASNYSPPITFSC